MIKKGSGTGGFHGTPLAERSTILFWGANVSRRAVVHQASITDVVPTLLALAGVSIPSNLDGQVLAQVIASEDLTDQEHEPNASIAEAAVSLETEEVQVNTSQFALEYPTHKTAYLTHDCGAIMRIKAIGIESDAGSVPVGPRLYTIEVSSDGSQYYEFSSGVLGPVSDVQVAWTKSETPVQARFIRLVAYPILVTLAMRRLYASLVCLSHLTEKTEESHHCTAANKVYAIHAMTSR